MVNQGIDLWLSGMVGAFVEEEVITWLRDASGYDEGGWGVLTSGGVMANLMGLAVARDVHLASLRALAGASAGGALEGARVYASDQAHFSIERALDLLGFPPETLRVLPSDDGSGCARRPSRSRSPRTARAGLLPSRSRRSPGPRTPARRHLDDLADLAAREGLWLHVDAAYGGAARLSAREGIAWPASSARTR